MFTLHTWYFKVKISHKPRSNDVDKSALFDLQLTTFQDLSY